MKAHNFHENDGSRLWCTGSAHGEQTRQEVYAKMLTKAGAAHAGVRPDLHELAHRLNGLCRLRCQLPGGRQDETLRPAQCKSCQKMPFKRLTLTPPFMQEPTLSSAVALSRVKCLMEAAEAHSKIWESRSCSRETAIMDVFPVPDCAWAITSLPWTMGAMARC